MSLSQPSRTIVVEPVQLPRTALAPPSQEPPRREVEAPAPEETPATP